MEISTSRIISVLADGLRTFYLFFEIGEKYENPLQTPHLQSEAIGLYLGKDADHRTDCKKVQCRHFLNERFRKEPDIAHVSRGF